MLAIKIVFGTVAPYENVFEKMNAISYNRYAVGKECFIKVKRGNLMFCTIELFAGAGGLALGIEKAGFDTLGLIEFDKDAADTLKKNRPNWNVIHDDIANISRLDLEKYFHLKKGELDLLSGGAPCQAFSYAGKRLGLEDARGLLTHDHGNTYKTM